MGVWISLCPEAEHEEETRVAWMDSAGDQTDSRTQSKWSASKRQWGAFVQRPQFTDSEASLNGLQWSVPCDVCVLFTYSRMGGGVEAPKKLPQA